MPAFRTCVGTRLEKKWNVGSDDFVLPAAIAILVRLVCFALTVGVIIYLYFPCKGVEIPPLLYGSLFVLIILQVVVIFNEGVIFSVSCRGTIMNPDPRRRLATILYIRIVLFCIEVFVLVIPTYASYSSVAGDVNCSELQEGPLIYAKVITAILWVTLLIFGVVFLFFVDPIGCFTSGLLQRLDFLDSMDDKEKGAAKELNQHFKLHRSHSGQRNILRRLSALCCCLGLKGHRSRGTALEEISKAMHTLFKDVDIVPSDFLCGLILVNKDQKRKKQECSCRSNCICLGKDYKDLTFETMPVTHVPKDYQHKESVPFDFSNESERQLFEDLSYYMHYCMGIYGWPLTVFTNPFCGLCNLASATCCLCNFRCWTDTRHIIGDNCCMCGIGSHQLHTRGRNVDMVYISHKNDFFQVPFSLCIDHDKKTVVVSIRGSLSIKDALTNMTMSLEEIAIEECPYKATFVHRGMRETAEKIKSILEDKKHLKSIFKNHQDYQLVVTGHSLGAGVASILAVLLKPAYPSLICYAFSPPGCIFSFPLAVWSRQFITSVVVGNDFVPRLSFLSLLYLKKQLMFLLNECKMPKHQVLFQPSWSERFNNPFCCKARETPSVSADDIQPKAPKLLNSKETGVGAKPSAPKELRKFGNTATGVLKAKVAASRWNNRTGRRIRRRASSISGWVGDIYKNQRVTSFPPGKVIYIDVVQNCQPCLIGKFFPGELAVTHISGEDLSIIHVGRGMVDDHMPHNVLGALHRAKEQFIGKRQKQQQRQESSNPRPSKRRWPQFSSRRGELAILVEEDELNDLVIEQFELAETHGKAEKTRILAEEVSVASKKAEEVVLLLEPQSSTELEVVVDVHSENSPRQAESSLTQID